MLTALAIGAMAGSQIYSGMAAQAQGKSEQAMANYNAMLEQKRAKEIEEATAIKQRKQAEAAARKRSELEARLGASGAVTTTGAPLAILGRQAEESEKEIIATGREGMISAGQARSQAAMDVMGGKLARTRARHRAFGSYVGAGTSLIKPFARKYEPQYWGS